MKQTTVPFEDKIRRLIILAKDPLVSAKVHYELHIGKFTERDYADIVESLQLILDIAKDLGYKKPEGTTLKQIEIPY